MLTIVAPVGFEAEKEYVCAVLMGELLELPWRLQFSPDTADYCISLPNGRRMIIEDGFWGKVSTGEDYCQARYLPASAWRMPLPSGGRDLIGIYGHPVFHTTPEECRCGLDVFASAFFMLTRWEEAVRPERDVFGRFPAQASLAWQAGFLHRPVVNEYAQFLARELCRLGFPVPVRRRQARLHLSCDVDYPRLWWSFADRWRTLGGSLLRRKDWREALWWICHHLFSPQDPFDVFEAWMDAAERKGLVWHFNFLGERPKDTDAYYSLRHPFVQRLLRRIAQRGHIIGFHPSREACTDPAAFERELTSLRKTAPAPVHTGRQHFLCFRVPNTWQQWADAGMHWDSSMGYPEAEGFRCGICGDFPVFNVRTRKRLPLREKPLIAMDVALAHYRRYTPVQAAERLQDLWRITQEHGGEFVLLWHNSSSNDYFWKDWQAVLYDWLQ